MILKSSEKTDVNMTELVATVDAETFEKAIEAVYQQQKKNISLPGFRKGKVPRRLCERTYGEGVFFEDALNLILNMEMPGVIAEAALNLVDAPKVEVTSVSKEDGATVKIICVTKPEIHIADYKGMTAPKEDKEITDEDVAKQAENVCKRNAKMVSVDDRAAEMGDEVTLDFEGFFGDTPFEGGKGEDFQLKLGSGQFIPGFEEQMVGMTVGEEKDLNVTFPEKYHAENLAGKKAVFHVKVNSITKTELPELDDDFAQDNGFDTFDAYKADVAKKLQEIADTNYDVEIENALIEKAVANAQMDIPAAMIDDQLNYVMRDVEYSMMRQGLRMEDYLKYTGQTREQMAQQYRGEAENRVKIQLVLEAIRKAENIEPTAEEIDEQSAKQAKRAGQEVEAFKANLTDEHKAYLSDLAAIQKVCDLMKAGATVVDKKPEEAAETAEETKTEE